MNFDLSPSVGPQHVLCVSDCLRYICGGLHAVVGHARRPQLTSEPTLTPSHQQSKQLIGDYRSAGLTYSRYVTRPLLLRRRSLNNRWTSCHLPRRGILIIDSSDTSLRLAAPESYAVVDVPRQSSRQGGGVAIIYRKHLQCSILPMPFCSTMEIIAVKLTTSGGPVIIVNIIPAQIRETDSAVFDELAAVLETFVLNPCPVVVGGDLNVHVEDDLIASFDMSQHVREAIFFSTRWLGPI